MENALMYDSRNSESKDRMQENLYTTVKHSNHVETLMNGLRTLFENKTLADVLITIPGTTYTRYCHSIMLIGCSPYFKDLISDVQKYSHTLPIIIALPEIAPAIMESMLQYIYKGEINLDKDDIDTFKNLAIHLQIRGFIEPEAKVKLTPIMPSIPKNDIIKNDESKSCAQSEDSILEPEVVIDESLENLSNAQVNTHLERKMNNIMKSCSSATLQQRTQVIQNNSNPKFALEKKIEFLTIFELEYQNNKAAGVEIVATNYTTNNKPINKIRKRGGVEKRNKSKVLKEKKFPKYKTYDPEALAAALQMARSGETPLRAASIFKVPARTVYDRLQKERAQTNSPKIKTTRRMSKNNSSPTMSEANSSSDNALLSNNQTSYAINSANTNSNKLQSTNGNCNNSEIVNVKKVNNKNIMHSVFNED